MLFSSALVMLAAPAVAQEGPPTSDALAEASAGLAGSEVAAAKRGGRWRRWVKRIEEREQAALGAASRRLLGKSDAVLHVAVAHASGIPLLVSASPSLEVVLAGEKAPVSPQVTSGVNVMSGVCSGVFYLRKHKQAAGRATAASTSRRWVG